MAVKAAEDKIKAGLLIPMNVPHDWTQDDGAETINSIYNLYREFVMPKDEGEIYNELYHKYHAYF